jgi:hypothetical protein
MRKIVFIFIFLVHSLYAENRPNASHYCMQNATPVYKDYMKYVWTDNYMDSNGVWTRDTGNYHWFISESKLWVPDATTLGCKGINNNGTNIEFCIPAHGKNSEIPGCVSASYLDNVQNNISNGTIYTNDDFKNMDTGTHDYVVSQSGTYNIYDGYIGDGTWFKKPDDFNEIMDINSTANGVTLQQIDDYITKKTIDNGDGTSSYTENNEDGSTTEYIKNIETGDILETIHTDTDGTVTTGYPDGSYDTTTYNFDGSYQTTHTATDGTTSTTNYNSDGTEYNPNQDTSNAPTCDDGAPALKVGNDFICDRNCNDVGYEIGMNGQCYNPQICTDKSNECIDNCPNGVKSFACTDGVVTSSCVCQESTNNNDDTTNNDNTDSQDNTNDDNSNVDDTDTTDDNSDNVNDDSIDNNDNSDNTDNQDNTNGNTSNNTNNDYSSAPAGGSGTGGNSLSEDLNNLTNAINDLQNNSGTGTTENTTVNFDDTNIVNAVNENKSILEDIKDGFTGVTDFLSNVTDLISNPSSIGDTINQYLVDSVDKYNEKFFSDTCQNIE